MRATNIAFHVEDDSKNSGHLYSQCMGGSYWVT